MLCCVYIRYLQVKSLATFKTPIGPRLSANDISWYVGFLSCLGMDIVANFQVHNLKYVHYAGAGLCFIGGSFYFAFQVSIKYIVLFGNFDPINLPNFQYNYRWKAASAQRIELKVGQIDGVEITGLRLHVQIVVLCCVVPALQVGSIIF